jgi:FSR family fosmidomycin resistance protein-like MFS transporter
VFSLSAFIPVLWHLRGESLVAGATVISAVITVGVAGNLFGGYLADRIGRRPVLLASAALVVPVAHVPGWWVFPVAAALGISLFLPAASAILIGQDIFPENRSMGSGIALGLANGLAAIAVLVVGLFVTESTVTEVFWILAALALACIVVALVFPARLMRREER